MKKVRVGLAAAGLAPAAAALLAPTAAATAATPAHTSAKIVKTDAIPAHHLTPDSSCTGLNWTRSPATGSLYLGDWWTRSTGPTNSVTCIGTVKGTFPADMTAGNNYHWRIRVYVSGGSPYHTYYPGAINDTTMLYAIKTSFFAPHKGGVKICSAIEHSTSGYVPRYCATP
jgi:hypothetical protein